MGEASFPRPRVLWSGGRGPDVCSHQCCWVVLGLALDGWTDGALEAQALQSQPISALIAFSSPFPSPPLPPFLPPHCLPPPFSPSLSPHSLPTPFLQTLSFFFFLIRGRPLAAAPVRKVKSSFPFNSFPFSSPWADFRLRSASWILG